MSAPGPPWTPEEDGLLRSMGAAGESAAAISALIKRSPCSRSTWPVRCQGLSRRENINPDNKLPDSTTDIVSAVPPAARELLYPAKIGGVSQD